MLLPLQSEANDKFNELEEQLQQIKDQIKVCTLSQHCMQQRQRATHAQQQLQRTFLQHAIYGCRQDVFSCWSQL
jgi:hypothetical protein